MLWRTRGSSHVASVCSVVARETNNGPSQVLDKAVE